MPLKRRQPLRAKTPLKGGSPMKRSPLKRTAMKQRPPKNPGFTRSVKNQALTRSGGRCEVGAPGCSSKVEHFHHRKLRSQGGTNTLDNALASCCSCHAYVHAHPQEAMERGWIISAFAGQPR